MTTKHNPTKFIAETKFTAQQRRRISKELTAWRAIRPERRPQLSKDARAWIEESLQVDTLGLPKYRSPRCGKRGRDLTEQLAELEKLGRRFAAEGRIEAAITELRIFAGAPARRLAIVQRIARKARKNRGGR